MKIKLHKAYDSETNKLSLFIEFERRIVCVPWARRFNDAAGRRQFALDMLLRGCGLMRPLSDLKRMMPGSFGQIDEIEISPEELKRERDLFLSSEGNPLNSETEMKWHHPL
ncbi:hypothetical protein ACNF1F_19345 [Escherichia coli]|jgi:hypothetical protein|uniref:hypothetical protein n=1 Tax=Escherichia coli TaxID=562 RepID=UPI000984A471|nr:hypothetical protein [Escherichia coli]UVY20719.1 MAG: hypothetical protein [Bacteriophage sp.]EFK2283411.1 hypothetical protein [Escherichia coli]EFK2335291.1 hypothetical protein [Escherichia coli]EFK3121203.1 hypothetical protein [Escherichia coli]EJQ0262576.1 hypothetical protein [Escherichia coli]